MIFINSLYHFDFKTVKIYEKIYTLHNQYHSAENHPNCNHWFVDSYCDDFESVFNDYCYYQHLNNRLKNYEK